jgi:hypothetical protein
MDPDLDNWAPRAGMAWSIGPRFVLRGGYAVEHGRMAADLVTEVYALNAAGAATVTLSGADGDVVPAFPARLAVRPAGARSDLAVFGERFEQARVRQTHASVEWEWMPATSLAVGYLHARGDSLPRIRDANAGAVTAIVLTHADDGQEVPYARVGAGPFPAYGRVIAYESTGRSRHDRLTVALHRRMLQLFQFRMSYTFGRSMDTGVVPSAPAWFDGPHVGPSQGVQSGSTEWRPAAHDVRHRFVASTVWLTDGFAERWDGLLKAALRGWRVGAVYSLTTGRPYSAMIAGDPDGNRNPFDDLAPGTGRHELRRGREGRVDVRFARDVALPLGTRLTASVEVFNVLNVAHYRDVDAVQYRAEGSRLFSNPRFGERSGAEQPRTLQLGMAFGF